MSKWKKPEGYVEKKYNYLYRLTLKRDPRFYYYGAHSTNHKPEFDGYEGSGTNIKRIIKEEGHGSFTKEIIGYYETREELLEAEENLVTLDMIKDPFCLNISLGGGTLDTTGVKMTDELKELVSARFKGKKRSKEAIEKMIATRRARGTDKHSPDTIEKLKEAHRNTVPINKNGKQKIIKKDDLVKYVSDGWATGYTEERNKKVSEAKKGLKNPNYGKPPKKETIEKMLASKYERGTNFHSQETREKLARLNREHAKDPEFCKKLSKACKGVNNWSKGRRRINKDGITKAVKPEELNDYLENGWSLGHGYKIRSKNSKKLE